MPIKHDVGFEYIIKSTKDQKSFLHKFGKMEQLAVTVQPWRSQTKLREIIMHGNGQLQIMAFWGWQKIHSPTV